MTEPKKPNRVPDFLPTPADLVDMECRHSNALAEALVAAIRRHYGAVSEYEIVGALEYVKRYAMNGGFAWPGSTDAGDEQNSERGA